MESEIWALPLGILADYMRLLPVLKKYGPNLPLPHGKPLGGKLFELRLSGSEGIARVLYCSRGSRRIVMLHSFVKKTQRTPLKELQLARKRMKEIQRHG